MSERSQRTIGHRSTLPLFLTDALPAEGATVALDGPEGRHAAAVRRMRSGEQLLLGDGCGDLARCEVVATGRDTLVLRMLWRWHVPPPALRVTVVQALVKGGRGELAVELATEAGADAVLPWRAERCVARWDDGPRGAKALARWQETARQAAKQARRSAVPLVADPVSTAELAARCGASVALVLHEAATVPLPAVRLPAAGEVLVVVGPEGGITDGELGALEAAGARPVRLGPEVLRTSTAAAVALSVLGAMTDRWLIDLPGEISPAQPDEIYPE